MNVELEVTESLWINRSTVKSKNIKTSGFVTEMRFQSVAKVSTTASLWQVELNVHGKVKSKFSVW